MSKAVKTDHKFNKQQFKDLLQKAKGKRTQTEYAKQAGVGIAYLNKYIKGVQETPPIPSTIFKLASAADNDISFDALLNAAGYTPQKYNNNNLTGAQLENLAFAILSRSLHSIAPDWELFTKQSKSSHHFDMYAQHKNKQNHDPVWFFDTKFGTPKIMIIDKKEWFSNIIGTYAVSDINIGDKVSIVTNDTDLFNEITPINHALLGFHLSIVLIDFTSMSVVEEKYIHTALLTEDRNRLPSFMKS